MSHYKVGICGVGFVGKGVDITTVKRVYNEFLSQQVLTAQTSSSQLDCYYGQISKLNNLLADSSAGLSPALQDFFKGIQDFAASPSSSSSRQSALSVAEGLAGRFKGIDVQLDEMYSGVNDQISSTVVTINSLAKQIAKLNDSIQMTQSAVNGNQPNDMYDQRDQLISVISFNKLWNKKGIKTGRSVPFKKGFGFVLKRFQSSNTRPPNHTYSVKVGFGVH